MISRVTPGFFRFAHFQPRGGLFFPGWINSHFARKSGLNRKFDQNNYLLNQKQNFLPFSDKIKRNSFGN